MNSESEEDTASISGSDTMKFVELQCSKEVMKCVCEYKGELLS